MKTELPHFRVGPCYGGNQDTMRDPMMKLGGCGALAALDTCILLAMYHNAPSFWPSETPVPEPGTPLSEDVYREMAMEVKPFLRPRWGGISRLETYIDGYEAFLKNRGMVGLSMEGFAGERPLQEAEHAVRSQIDSGLVVPCLMLNSKQKELKFYEWHWFLLNGYEETKEGLLVKATTYGSCRWLSFEKLWNTGHERKGGLILYHFTGEVAE